VGRFVICRNALILRWNGVNVGKHAHLKHKNVRKDNKEAPPHDKRHCGNCLILLRRSVRLENSNEIGTNVFFLGL